MEGSSGQCDESRNSLHWVGSLAWAQWEAGADSLERAESFPIQAVAQCRLALSTAFGWVSGFSMFITGKCSLIHAQSQPCSLSNEGPEAGSRSESQGDLPMLEYPFLWSQNCWENTLSLSVAILTVHLFCFHMPVLNLGLILNFRSNLSTCEL